MSTESKSATDSAVPSASELRSKMIEEEMASMERERKKREAEQQKVAEFTDKFMTEHVTEAERATIRRLVMMSVAQGKTEALVYSFPSSLCSDKGRMINNAERDWPATLQGKAKELYERFKTLAEPQGYKLKASILNFPGGMPGDVGLYLSWE
jgi:hypothetical protein